MYLYLDGFSRRTSESKWLRVKKCCPSAGCRWKLHNEILWVQCRRSAQRSCWTSSRKAKKYLTSSTTLTQDGGRTSTSEARVSNMMESIMSPNTYAVFETIESEFVSDVIRSAANPTQCSNQIFFPCDSLYLISYCRHVRLTRWSHDPDNYGVAFYGRHKLFASHEIDNLLHPAAVYLLFAVLDIGTSAIVSIYNDEICSEDSL